MNEPSAPQPGSAVPRDWLALLSQAEVVGPLTDAELRACLADGQIPPTARLFRFCANPDEDGQAAQLKAENARLTDSLRAAESDVRRLQADVKARDIEFEGERQQMAADMSKLRADGLRKDAQIETLEKNTALLAAAEAARADAEKKLREAELASARFAAQAADVDAAHAAASSLRQKAEALQKALDASNARLRDHAARLADLAKTLSAMAEETTETKAPSESPSPSPSLSAERKTAVRPFPSEKIEAEVIEPVVDRPGDPPPTAAKAPSAATPRTTDSRLAQLEARAREELAMLGGRGGATPRWARRKS